jgi:hypothetical protein
MMQTESYPSKSRGGSAWIRIIDVPFSALAFALGLIVYAVTKRTPRLSFHAMRRLYGPTRGLLNRAALGIARRLRPFEAPAEVSGFLGTFSRADIRRIVDDLERDGLAFFDRDVPAALCDELVEFAQTTPCLALGGAEPALYRADRADALRHDFSEAALLANDAVRRVVFDGTLAAIAGAYFRSLPIYDYSAMWWTTRFGKRDLSAAAQQYHFDMDRFHFLKFFVYLTDVTPDTGPHVYVAGSHKSKPPMLCRPSRFGDAEVESAFPEHAVRRICGRRGSIFAVDTSGIHKGMPVVEGHRLVFQVEFTISKFGQNYPESQVPAEALRRIGLGVDTDRRVFRNVH